MIPDIKGLGIVINNIVHFSPKETFNLCKKGAIIVDIREEFETDAKKFGVENLIYLANSEFYSRYQELPKDQLIIIADSFGLRSKKAVLFLQKNDYNQIANLNGGMVDWSRDNLPLEREPSEEFHGSCACMLKSKTRKMNFK